jgi:hypothetical protein
VPRGPDWLCYPSCVISPGVKRPMREFDHSSASSARLRMGGAMPPFSFCTFDECTGTTLLFAVVPTGLIKPDLSSARL